MAQAIRLEESEWAGVDVSSLRGLDFSKDAERVPPEALSKALNVRMNDGELETDQGIKLYQVVDVRGVPRHIHKHIRSNGSVETYLFTDECVYRKVSSQWKPLDNGDATTTTDTIEATAQTVIGVTATTGFTVNQLAVIELDDGTWHVANIDSIDSGVSITIDIGLPSGAASGNDCFEVNKLAGADTNPFHAVSMPFDDNIAFTNGIDFVQTLDVSTNTYTDTVGLTTTKCVSLAIFDNSLFLIGTNEAGTAFPRRAKWSAPGDSTDWTTASDGGDIDLYDTTHDLMFAAKIGPYLAIYRTGSIVRCIAENSGIKRFDFPEVISGEGIFSTHGVVNIGGENGSKHLVVGRRNVYEYKGGFELTPIGNEIQPQLLDNNARMEELNREKLFWFFDSIENNACIFYADSLATTYPNRVFYYDINSGKWTERMFGIAPGIEFAGWGETVDTNVLTWNDLIGSWLEQDFKWGGSNVTTSRPTFILCRGTNSPTHADNNTFEYSSITADDSGVAIVSTVETGDFRSPGIESRHDWIDLVAAGTAIEILYSKDKGVNWISLGSRTFSADIIKKRYYKQFMFDTIRFRFTSATYIRLIRYTFKSSLESE